MDDCKAMKMKESRRRRNKKDNRLLGLEFLCPATSTHHTGQEVKESVAVFFWRDRTDLVLKACKIPCQKSQDKLGQPKDTNPISR